MQSALTWNFIVANKYPLAQSHSQSNEQSVNADYTVSKLVFADLAGFESPRMDMVSFM